jgi:hypothetical protein
MCLSLHKVIELTPTNNVSYIGGLGKYNYTVMKKDTYLSNKKSNDYRNILKDK